MTIRSKLVIAFVLLGVLPLNAIVSWSYISSSRAVKEAVLNDAESATRSIEHRLNAARQMLALRVQTLEPSDIDATGESQAIAQRFGELAPLVDRVIVTPPLPPSPAPSAGTGVPAMPPVPPHPEMARSAAARERTRAHVIHVTSESVVDTRDRIEALDRQHEALRNAQLVLGQELRRTLDDGREIVINVHPEALVRRILTPGGGETVDIFGDESSDISFALDRDGTLYTDSPDHRSLLADLDLTHPGGDEIARRVDGDWVIATARDGASGLTVGIAHPVRESLARLRKTALTNLGAGIGVIGLAMLMIVPLANHLTRDLGQMTAAAQRIAGGNLETTVPVRSSDEVGALAVAFNHMARELQSHQTRLVEQEQLRHEQEVKQRLLEADHARKSDELEQARSFQLSLLPRTLPSSGSTAIAVHMETATEVGGDYYDFVTDGDDLVIAIGDATGHGARAGTMVTAVKSLFVARAHRLSPAAFIEEADVAIRRMDLGRMAMALAVARLKGNTLTIASAGMPSAIVYRPSSASVDELDAFGTPLGTLGGERSEISTSLERGDRVLLMSDGFAELTSAEGEPLGYHAVAGEFSRIAAAAGSVTEVIAGLRASVVEHRSGTLDDDVTFVVLEYTG